MFFLVFWALGICARPEIKWPPISRSLVWVLVLDKLNLVFIYFIQSISLFLHRYYQNHVAFIYCIYYYLTINMDIRLVFLFVVYVSLCTLKNPICMTIYTFIIPISTNVPSSCTMHINVFISHFYE